MADRRVRLDFAALGFLLAGLALALCILGYDPADPPGTTVYPLHPAATNLLGAPGAWLAQLVLETLGVATYVLLAAWFVLVVLLFLRHGLRAWSVRLAGWLLLIPCVAAGADYLDLSFSNAPLGGSGGTLGAWLTGWLETHLDLLGRIFLLGSCFLLSALLTTNFALFQGLRAASEFGTWILAKLWRVCRWLWNRRPLRSSPQLPGSGGQHSAQVTPSSSIPMEEDLLPPSGGQPAENGHIPIRHHDEAIASLEARTLEDCGETISSALLPVLLPPAESEETRFANYEVPPLTLLEEPQPFPYEEHDQRLRERAALLEKTFTDFGLNVRVVGINTGPVITQYEIALETGLRLYKVTVLADDLALNLKVPSVRIVAPIPGKNTVGIEIPNEHRAVVRLKEVILTAGKKVAKAKIPLFLGKDTEGRPLVYDLAEMPHLLIAGRTGTGKSVCMNAIILSILMTRRPDEVKMIMIDPKMLELSEYGRIPHLMHPVVKDMKKAEAILSWAVDKMEERYDLLSRARVRSIAAYNDLPAEEIHRRVQPADDEDRRRIPERMPYIVIFVDEMNDLMMTMKREVEGHIIRLAQKSRAAGIHLVVATQKPTVDVITGLIKSNLPARICFQVSSRTDSRVVLDEMGADKLLGKGDMLFLQPGTSTLVRSQGTYASDEEITRVVERLHCDPCYSQELVQLSATSKEGGGSLHDTLRARDDLYEQAIEVIIREGRGSVSLLQRALGIGYGRAARLIDFMAEDGIVGDYNGSQAREVRYTPEQWEQVRQAGALA
jgi:S-DNA-T family DNA segregation ATPase FtsK/SpoIIIE